MDDNRLAPSPALCIRHSNPSPIAKLNSKPSDSCPPDGILGGQFNSHSVNKTMKEKTRLCRSTQFAVRCIGLVALLGLPGISAFPVGVEAADQPSMTVILVRHAEKKIVPPENKDPDLSPAGVARAEELARMFGDAGITGIYATQYKRTQQTVKPLADKLGLQVSQVEAAKTPELVKQLRARKSGEVVFIAGHNNNVPEIIAALGGPKLPIIPETDFDNLYILTVQSDGSAKLLKLKYGSSLPASGQGMMKQ
jgi:phosphohistidine phosphatase SixA